MPKVNYSNINNNLKKFRTETKPTLDRHHHYIAKKLF